MIVKINKHLILESLSLIEEELSQMAKNGLKASGAGLGIAAAHAGALGSGAQHFVDNAGSAAKAMADRAGTHMGNSADAMTKFYGNNGEPKTHSEPPVKSSTNPDTGETKHSPEQTSSEDTETDDDDIVGTGLKYLGGGALALGAAKLGMKGKEKFDKSDAKKSFIAGTKGRLGPKKSNGFMNRMGQIQKAALGRKK